jgi:hypothetical protein
MPVDSKRNLTMLDIKSRLDPNGKVARIIEMLEATNEILQDMVTKEGNLETGHRTTMRTGLPTVGWKTLYKGVEPSKSTTAQVDDTCGILEALSTVDEDALKINGNAEAYRLSESRAFLEAMNQEMARSLFYENSKVNPERPHGLAVRYSTLDPAVPISENIIDAGGTTGELTSIWLIVWGDQTLHAIYPKGSEVGLQHIDIGKEKMEWTGTGPGGVIEKRIYYGVTDQYKWKLGFSVPDWRYAVRIVNIPVNNISAVGLIDLMIDAIERIPSLSMGRGAWYMNRPMRTALRKEIKNVTNVHLSLNEVAGRRVLYFDELPVRRVDALVNTESRVV